MTRGGEFNTIKVSTMNKIYIGNLLISFFKKINGKWISVRNPVIQTKASNVNMSNHSKIVFGNDLSTQASCRQAS